MAFSVTVGENTFTFFLPVLSVIIVTRKWSKEVKQMFGFEPSFSTFEVQMSVLFLVLWEGSEIPLNATVLALSSEMTF